MSSSGTKRNCIAATVAALLALGSLTASGQQPSDVPLPAAALRMRDVTTGSAAEHTFLILRLIAPDLPRDSGRAIDSAGPAFQWSVPQLGVWVNTGRARADRDGAVWQGRGLTGAITGGFTVKRSVLSVALRPMAFVSQNVPFTPAEPGRPADDFRARLVEGGIDMPYRFGARSYGRVDPGESWVRLDAWRLGLGASTASQRWGPAHLYPLVMGTEGAGFPRVFAEVRRAPVGVGSIDVHWQIGRLEASPIATLNARPGARSRLATALVATFAPAGFKGLEIGGSRFFHVRWERGVVSWPVVSLPFAGLLKEGNPTGETSQRDFNQLASVFARVAPPGGGVEVYGELYREDHNVNLRDLAGEPDHLAAYTVGIRRVWKRDDDVAAFTLEGTNGRMSHLARVRPQGPVYVHGAVEEGHTYLGQPLGSTATLGGSGLQARLERVGQIRTQFLSAEVRRSGHNMEGGSWSGRQTGLYLLEAGGMRMVGRRTYGVTAGLQSFFGEERGINVSLALVVRGIR